MNGFLVRLYPARWRARYGEEFRAILEERPLGPFDVVDIVLGALDARLRMRGAGATINGSVSMSLRIGGYAAIIGGALTATGIVAGIGLVDVDASVAGLMFITGSAALIVALAGLSAFQARVHPVLSWTALVAALVGTVLILGAIAMSELGGDWLSGAFAAGAIAVFGGSTLFALVTFRTAALSRGAAVLLGVGSVTTAIAGFGGNALPPVFLILAAIAFTLGWFALGVHAVRIDRPAPAVKPA